MAEAIHRRFPQEAEADFILARAQARGGQVEAALSAYRRVLERDPARAEAWEAIGDLLAQKGQPREALEAYRKALAGGPAALEWLEVKMAGELFTLGRLEEAEKLLKEVVAHLASLRPETADRQVFASSLYQLAQVKLAQGRAREAVGCLERALQAGEPSKSVYYALARAHYQSGDRAAAEKAQEQFVKLSARDRERKRDFTLKAREEERLRRRNQAMAHLEIAALLRRKRLPEEALEHLGWALEIDGEFGEARFARAQLLEALGRLAEALEDFEALLREKPELASIPAYRLGVGSVCRQRARELLTPPLVSPRTVPEALELSRRALEFDPSAASYEVRAWALLAARRRDDGIAALEEAARLDPQNPEYRAKLEALKK